MTIYIETEAELLAIFGRPLTPDEKAVQIQQIVDASKRIVQAIPAVVAKHRAATPGYNR